jgi:hypothetical protein
MQSASFSGLGLNAIAVWLILTSESLALIRHG